MEETEKLYNDYTTEITIEKTERMKFPPPMMMQVFLPQKVSP
jgi:hypothetical protein